MTDTYLFDGVDIRSAARYLDSGDGQFDIPDLVGSDLSFPQLDGDVPVTDRTFDAGTFTLPLALLGSVSGSRADSLRALVRMVRPGRTVTVTRQRSYPTGTETHTATCRYVNGLSPTTVGPLNSRVALTMKVLGGLWDGSTQSLGTFGSGTTTTSAVLGDTRTRKVYLNVSGVTGTVTIRNNTNGYVLTIAPPSTAAVDIDVLARTAFHGSTDLSQYLTWTKTVPFQLDEGVNSLTISGGTGTPSVVVSYKPAYF
jgi:hypothetical protein